jgi:hypothetical protein
MRFFGSVGLLLGLLVPCTEAQTRQTQSFLNSLSEDGEYFDFEFFRKGLSSVQSITFDHHQTAHFKPFWNSINLDRTSNDGAGRIRAWHLLSPIDLGVLAHESFHAFVFHFWNRHLDWQREKEWFETRARVLFHDLAPHDARVALEEAYATFLGNTITSARTLLNIVDRYEGEHCGRTHEMLRRLWQKSWEQPTPGYYYRDGIVDFWADRARWLFDRVKGGSSRADFGEPIFTKTTITRLDRKWISNLLFEGRWNENFDQSFPEIAEKLEDCSQEELISM